MASLKGNKKIQLQISELYIWGQMFCSIMNSQNACPYLLLGDSFKLYVKPNILLNKSNCYKGLIFFKFLTFLEYSYLSKVQNKTHSLDFQNIFL